MLFIHRSSLFPIQLPSHCYDLICFGNGEVQLFFGMSAGTAAAVISYITQVFTPLESIGMEIQTIQSAAAGVHRINEFLQLPERTKARKTNTSRRIRLHAR